MKLITETLPALNYGEGAIREALRSNAAIDLRRGFTLPESLVTLVRKVDLKEDPKAHSLLELGLFLSKRCNAACPACYCGESRLDSELTREQKEDLILQAKALGARAVYTAGAGEPTIDKDFLHLARFIHEQGLEWVVYSNGITFSNERQALRNTGLTPRQLAEKVAEYGVTIVYKLWSTDANTNNQLTGTRSSYDYQKQIVRTRDGSKAAVDLSTGLLLLQEVGSKLALETLCTARTFDDVYHVIVPLAEQLELPIIVEPILLNGGAKEQESLILNVEQLGMIDPYLTDFGPRNLYSVVIDNRGYMHLSHGTVNLANPNPDWNAVGRLFEVLHSDQVIATHRYERLPELR